MSRRKTDLRREVESVGRPAIVLDTDAVIRLLRTMVEIEGGQTAFANHHGVDRTQINMVLNGKRRHVGGAIAKALKLRKVYVVDGD